MPTLLCCFVLIGRLIDDIFTIWEHTESELLTFFQALNNYHPTIKYEINYSNNKVNFLDTTVYMNNNYIYTTLYIKHCVFQVQLLDAGLEYSTLFVPPCTCHACIEFLAPYV